MKYVSTLAAVVVLVAVACVPAPPPDGEPELCQPGSFSTTGEEPCDPAPAGTFVDAEGATEATACAPGTYQDQEGQTSCDPAEPGSYVDVAGAESATLCPLGRYQPLAGQTSCLLAPIGTYVDTTGAIAAINCPVGQTTASEGSTSSSDCYAPASVLAIAYSNLDGTAGYTEGGLDRLISRLVDTNTDGVPSAGDTIELGEYPLDIAASAFGSFQTPSLAVTGTQTPPPGIVAVEAAGWIYYWNGNASQGYGEVSQVTMPVLATDPAVIVGDADSSLDPCCYGDAIQAVFPGPPSDPDTAVDPYVVSQPPNVGDNFLEIELFVAAPI